MKLHGSFSLSLAMLLLTCADCAAERAEYSEYMVVLILLRNLLRAASGRREVAIKMLTFVCICFE